MLKEQPHRTKPKPKTWKWKRYQNSVAEQITQMLSHIRRNVTKLF